MLSLTMIVLSGSKASFLGLFIFIFLTELFREDSTRANSIWRILLFLLTFAALYLVFFSNDIRLISRFGLVNLRYRLMNLEADDQLWMGRGYQRITEVGIHFLWGMGEGDFYRFTSLNGVEAHSAYVTIYVSYGLIGLFGYAYLFKRTLGETRKADVAESTFYRFLSLNEKSLSVSRKRV